MTQTERRLYLIRELLKEQPEYAGLKIPKDEYSQKRLLRSLFNIRMPRPASQDFLAVQDTYLQEETKRKGITDFSGLQPVQEGIYLWQGDITTLRCDAIVNAANSQMLGCFVPCHGCIDNAIHTFAGIQLRLTCAELMKRQGHEEETGKAKITPAFNLPCRYILHTVGPIIYGAVTKSDCELLSDCYRSCLELASENGLGSVAFCCISTGEFHFPNEKAAEIAIQTVKKYKKLTRSKIEVIFNVFKDSDYKIYKRLLR
jgi:O-acetyl-ADP-ribose deacetylase (regulator of RNase III)